MENIIFGGVTLLILLASVSYVIRSKKKGNNCVGCPYGSQQGSSCSCNASKK